jgi:hypothetical protein
VTDNGASGRGRSPGGMREALLGSDEEERRAVIVANVERYADLWRPGGRAGYGAMARRRASASSRRGSSCALRDATRSEASERQASSMAPVRSARVA